MRGVGAAVAAVGWPTSVTSVRAGRRVGDSIVINRSSPRLTLTRHDRVLCPGPSQLRNSPIWYLPLLINEDWRSSLPRFMAALNCFPLLHLVLMNPCVALSSDTVDRPLKHHEVCHLSMRFRTGFAAGEEHRANFLRCFPNLNIDHSPSMTSPTLWYCKRPA
jgi:hypothetical protein